MKPEVLEKEKKDKSKFDSKKRKKSFRRALSRCKERVVSLMNLYDASPPGWVTVDKANLVRKADGNFCALVNETAEIIVGKPLSLFIVKEDIVLFFARRNIVFSDNTREIFDLGFRRKDSSPVYCRVECQLAEPEKTGTDEMRMAVTDITRFRQRENDLQRKDDLLKIVFSLSGDLNNAPPGECEHAVRHCLKTVGLFAGAERCFICMLRERGKKLYNEFEWCSDGCFSKKSAISGLDASRFPRIVSDMRRNKIVSLRDLQLLSPGEKREYETFHTPGVKSLLTVPIVFAGSVVGIIGLDAASGAKNWNEETTDLLRLVSESFANMLFRRRFLSSEAFGIRSSGRGGDDIGSDEKNRRAREHRLWIDNSFDAEAAGDDFDQRKQEGTAVPRQWIFSRANAEDVKEAIELRKNESNIFSISCPQCRGETKTGYSQLAECGYRVEARCPCGKKFHLKIESREVRRKNVHLGGFFTKKNPADRFDCDHAAWGNIVVTNISKKGAGFRVLEGAGLRKGDLLRMTFNLDNELGSKIEKEAEVKNVSGDYIGCAFTKADKYDVTLGFYLM